MTHRQISCLHRTFHVITTLIALCLAFLATPGVTDAQTVRGVVMGQPGDRWLDAIQYTRVERATVGGAFGYAITYDIPEAGRLILFWPRSAIDLEGKDPPAERLVMDIPGGHLYYPETITARSLPKVYDGILWLEGKYRADARGGMAAAQAFALVFASAEAAPALVTVSTRLLTVRSAGRVVTVLEEKVPSVAATTEAATTAAAEASTSVVVSATPAGAMAQPVAASAARTASTTAITVKPTTAKPAQARAAAAKPAQARPATAKPVAVSAGGVANSAKWTPAMERQLSHATRVFRNGPLTNVGRALTKHPNIIGESGNLLQTLGGAAQVNAAGAKALENIMRTGTMTTKSTKAFGDIIQYTLESGLGARFSAKTDEFIGFIGRGL